ncbi:hypothetical protein GCM10029976_059410 [Kribbella albertanoniae]
MEVACKNFTCGDAPRGGDCHRCSHCNYKRVYSATIDTKTPWGGRAGGRATLASGGRVYSGAIVAIDFDVYTNADAEDLAHPPGGSPYRIGRLDGSRDVSDFPQDGPGRGM